jgi:hypothetical protein
MIVKPEILVTPDYPIIRIREPREAVDLAAELPKVLTTQGWGIGTFFHVQFISHDRGTLLASAQFVVTQETEALLKRDIDNYQTMTKSVTTRKCEQIGPWWFSEKPTVDEAVLKAAMRAADPPVFGSPASIQHKGFGNFAILDDSGNQIRLVTKEEGGKARAQAIVSGKEPLEVA